MIRVASVLLASFFVAACGSIATSPSIDVPRDSGVGVGDSSTLPIVDGGVRDASLAGPLEGSYDITFTNVTATPGQGGPPPLPVPPSTGKAARLDLRARAGGGYDAVITARWGDPSGFTVASSAKEITLSGGNAGVGGSGASDGWTSLVFARNAAGSLDGSFTATGNEQVSMGDEIWDNPASARGTLTRDVTAPETKATHASYGGPPLRLLPWDPIRVRVGRADRRQRARRGGRVRHHDHADAHGLVP